MDIKLLDCTLRDGSHVNKGDFKYETIITTISGLVQSGIDFVELGFLRDCNYNKDVSYYTDIRQAECLLPDNTKNTEFSVMCRPDWYSFDKYFKFTSGKIKYIRIAFHGKDLDLALKFAQMARENGFKIAFNPVNVTGYKEPDLRAILRKIAAFSPYSINIVDTFGALYPDTLESILSTFADIVPGEIIIGLHPHENLSQSLANSIRYLEFTQSRGQAILDSSLMGMGRIPGNMPTEIIMDYLNKRHSKQYELKPVVNLIEKCILPVREKYSWGYNPYFFLSAIHNVNRTYAEYLSEKGLSLNETAAVIKKIPDEEKNLFNNKIADILNCETSV